MMKTVVCHIYNEHYLLPWWLKYHRAVFDHGIIIDYASTDGSVDIVKSMCPTWEVLPSRNRDFEAHKVDQEVMEVEKGIEGWKCCLNVTEFLLGNFSLLTESSDQLQYFAPCFAMVDENMEDRQPDYSKHIFEQFYHGMDIRRSTDLYCWREIHNFDMVYRPGRHFRPGHHFDERFATDYKFIVLKYVFAPMTEDMINRKLQIQHKIPPSDVRKNRGHYHHDHGRGLTRDKLINRYNIHKIMSGNIKTIIDEFNPLK